MMRQELVVSGPGGIEMIQFGGRIPATFSTSIDLTCNIQKIINAAGQRLERFFCPRPVDYGAQLASEEQAKNPRLAATAERMATRSALLNPSPMRTQP